MGDNCNVCDTAFSRTKKEESSIACSSGCGKEFHIKCVGLAAYDLNLIKGNTYILFMCTGCREKNILLKAIEKHVDVMEESVEEIKDAIEEQKEKIDLICESIHNMRMNDNNINQKLEKVCNVNMNKSYAEIAKACPKVIIKPKNKNQNSLTTKNEIKSKINLIENNLSIAGVSNAKNGAIVVSCENEVTVNKIKSIADENLNEYEVKVASGRKPRLRVIGISEDLNENELFDKIKAQNIVLKDSELILKTFFKNNKLKYNPYVAVIETDIETYNNIMKIGKIKIGWDVCKILDGTYIKRCFKCLGFGHESNKCTISTNNKVCANCAEEYDGDHNCNVTEKKCCNCIRINNDINLNLDVNHSAFDLNCHVYKRKIEIERKKIF